MLQDLLADDHVEGAGPLDMSAEVKRRIIEALVASPPSAGMRVAADLGSAEAGDVKLGESRIHGAIEDHTLPLLGCGLGLRIALFTAVCLCVRHSDHLSSGAGDRPLLGSRRMSRAEATTGEAGTGLEARLDRRLPASTTVGSSTAALCAGTCFHPKLDVESVWISVDGVRHSPSARRMPRPDLVEEFGPRAYRSGFWGTVPIRAPDRPGEIELRVNVQLADGSAASARLGAMAAVERPRPIEIDRRRADGKSLIAICMTSYNPDLDLFRTQVDSIRAQTDDAWVCLISDDCSEPERFDAITATVAGDERFVVSRAEENLGFYRNFERVLAIAPPEADLIALSDHDDYWYPDKLATLRAALGGAGLAYSDSRRVDSAGNVRTATLWRGRRPNHSNLASLLISNTITGAACLYRRHVIERALPFPEGPGWDFHDHWLALVALALGDIVYVDRPLYDYVQHRGAVIGRVAMNPPPNPPATRTSLSRRVGVWRSAYFTRYLQLEVHATFSSPVTAPN